MQYDAIILELMARIKVLEDHVDTMKSTIGSLEATIHSMQEREAELELDLDIPVTPVTISTSRNTTPYTKMTEQMMDVCYSYGKKAYQDPDANIGDYADIVSHETGMNRNSAFMYIHGVKNMLEGKVFKRAISSKAVKKYFDTIYSEFGEKGLAKAITATREHIKYRHSNNLPTDSIAALCDEFQSKL